MRGGRFNFGGGESLPFGLFLRAAEGDFFGGGGGLKLPRWKEPRRTVEGVKTHGGGSQDARWWELWTTQIAVF